MIHRGPSPSPVLHNLPGMVALSTTFPTFSGAPHLVPAPHPVPFAQEGLQGLHHAPDRTPASPQARLLLPVVQTALPQAVLGKDEESRRASIAPVIPGPIDQVGVEKRHIVRDVEI